MTNYVIIIIFNNIAFYSVIPLILKERITSFQNYHLKITQLHKHQSTKGRNPGGIIPAREKTRF